MKNILLSEYIAALEELRVEHGDIQVVRASPSDGGHGPANAVDRPWPANRPKQVRADMRQYPWDSEITPRGATKVILV